MTIMNQMTAVLLGSTALAMGSVSAAQDLGIKDQSFESGITGAWLKTEYELASPSWGEFKVSVQSESCDGIDRVNYLNMKIEDMCHDCWYEHPPTIWQDEIRLEDCGEGTHVILRFDNRVRTEVSFDALEVAIEAYSESDDLVARSSRRLLSKPTLGGEGSTTSSAGPDWDGDCEWTTDEVALPIPADHSLSGLSFRVSFELVPWGLCSGVTYAEADLDQMELFLGTPADIGEEFIPPCGEPWSPRLVAEYVAAPVLTMKVSSDQPERNFYRAVVHDSEAPTCESMGFSSCLADWPVARESFVPATRACEASPCPADFDGNGLVNGADLVFVLGNWGTCDGCIEDINGDGRVDGADLVYVLGTWGECP